MTFQKQKIMMLIQAQCVFLKSASMACNNGEENATFNSGTLLLKTIGIEICPKEPCFLVLITELGLQSICLLQDKHDQQYAVVGYARVRKRNAELTITLKVSCRKMTFQKQKIMMLIQAQCVFLKSASMACK